MYSLPQEIINLIVDAIGARNKVDLCRLALTSRVFLSQAQSQLYRSIKLELSYCIQQISKDLSAFHTILLQSQNIKFYIREIFVNSLVFSNELYNRDRIRRCPHHARFQKQHLSSPKREEQFHTSNIARFFSIIPMLSRLTAIRLNYGPRCQRDWRYSLSRGGHWQNVISSLCFERAITTLTLSSLYHVPVAVMDSILQLSQLTVLFLNDILLDDTVSVLHHPRHSQLTCLDTFGFLRMGYYPVISAGSHGVKDDMAEIAALIVHSSSKTLRKLIWSAQMGGKWTAVTDEALNSLISHR